MLRRNLLICSMLITSACGPLARQGETSEGQGKGRNIGRSQVSAGETREIGRRLQEISAQQESAKEAGDTVVYHTLQLEANFLGELADLGENPTPEAVEELNSKYEVLQSIFEADVQRYEEEKDVFADSPIASYEMKDVPYEGPNFTSVYHPRVLQEVKRVMKDFGDLYIAPTLDAKGKVVPVEARSKEKPWSGFWYPFGSAALYEGPDSPLGKFDLLLRKLGHDSHVAEKEAERYKGFHPDGWEGLCDAWAMAAVTSKEPKEAKTIHGVHFTIGDQKALLTYSHLKHEKVQYGIPYRGDAETDGTFQDIKPEAFHRIVTKVLEEERRALVIDDMSGVQVWNKPLYRMRWKVWQDPKIENAFLVTSYPWLIKERSVESEELTSNRDTIAPVYNYRLYVDKRAVVDGKYKVIAGQWIGDSFRDHPDTLIYPVMGEQLGSHNAEFNKYLKVFKKYFLSN